MSRSSRKGWWIALLLCQAWPAIGAEWTLERLYRRPYIWGTPPQTLRWSKEGHTLAFLWNAEGHRFRDLYAYHPDARRLARLTDLQSFHDDLLAGEAEKDEVRKYYLEPEAGIRSFALSRDGTKAVFSFKGDIFVVPTSGTQPPFRLTRTKAAETSPQFSPDGRQLAYMREGQLYMHDLATGQIWQLTAFDEEETLLDFEWAPDGSQFACLVQAGKQRQMPLGVYAGRLLKTEILTRTLAGDEPPPVALYLVDALGRRQRRVELSWDGKAYPSSPIWSQNSRWLAIRLVHPAMKREQILIVDPTLARARVLYEEFDARWVYWSEFGFSPDGEYLWLVSERDGWAHLYTVPCVGGELRQVTRGPFEARPEGFSFDPEEYGPQWVGDYLYYLSTEDGTAERHFYRIRPDGTGKERLSSHEGINVGVVSEDGRHIAWLRADLEHPADLWVDHEQVTRRVRPEFSQFPWPRTRFVQFPSRADGKPVAAKLLLPPGYDPDRRDGKKWPAVFFIHGAGYATSVLKQWGSYQEERYVFNCYLANQGYVILDLDYRGSSGYGREWRSEVYLHLGGLDLQDVLGGIDYLRSLGNIDMARIGIWGVSYGGFMTNMAMFLAPEAFKAGASWAAVNDWHNYNAGYTRQRLNTPAENPEAYRRSSPVYFSSLLKNPLLIVHGMLDRNVLFQDAVHLTEKLIREGKLFAKAFYPEEDHGFVREETWVDACRRTAEWFERYLK